RSTRSRPTCLDRDRSTAIRRGGRTARSPPPRGSVMVQRVRARSLAALVVLALSTALSAMVTVGVASSKVSATTGVDPSTMTVKIAVVGLDFQALVNAGIIPDLGKLVDQFKQLQNEINSGGQAGK